MATYTRSFSNPIPNKIALKRFRIEDQIDYMKAATGTSIIPGHLIEPVWDSTLGELAWQPNSSATNICPKFVALDFPEQGQVVGNATTVDTPYTPGDIVHAWGMPLGAEWWGLVPSGQVITNPATALQSNGDGTCKVATAVTAAANVAHFISSEGIGTPTVLTRCKIRRVV